jgi:hypothetical protein|tara:strand:+ start:20588 stop:20977 length:390 start_codon:yes stop_codon:yes gene_type:complete
LKYNADKFLRLWVDLFNGLEAQSLVDLYDSNATLIPTFSPNRTIFKADIKNYFDGLFTKDSVNVTVNEVKENSFNTLEGLNVIYGTYTFSFKADKTFLKFPARFTFLLDFNRPGPIIHHHSSLISEIKD